ncbi:hypothetical protein BGX26_012694 [Mortierella sp. AD094]|nr:hypothetical protein BGX26_012694 [Mortierella sp. AD094]
MASIYTTATTATTAITNNNNNSNMMEGVRARLFSSVFVPSDDRFNELRSAIEKDSALRSWWSLNEDFEIWVVDHPIDDTIDQEKVFYDKLANTVTKYGAVT